MKTNFIFFDEKICKPILHPREGEEKIGEKMHFVSNFEELKESKCKFVVFGIPEDIGVRANNGNGGTQSTWAAFLKSFVNIQSNLFIPSSEICILGAFDFSELLSHSKGLECEELKKLTEKIDEIVFEISLKIFASGKIPIAIGGGHNNSYPLLKSAYTFYNQKISAINLDAHADLRKCDGRHSGNGFSYAKQNGFLDKYFMLGLHENYNNAHIVNTILNTHDFKAIYFDNLIIRNNSRIEEGFSEAKNFIDKNLCGIELDLDAIKNTQTSAESPSGFTVEDARKFSDFAGSKLISVYFHICEGIYDKGNGQIDPNLPKLISYLVMDFIKAFQNK